MGERRRVIFEGIEAEGMPTIAEQVKQELGIDITKDSEQYKLEFDGATDDKGISDTLYTNVKVVRVIPSVEPVLEPVRLPTPVKNKKVIDVKKQDMLDKYYGNIKKEMEYQSRIKRFKSHIVDKKFEYEGENGEILTGTYKTIEPYQGKEGDEEFLQLEDYAYKLERLSRAEAGDVSGYKTDVERKKEIKIKKVQREIEVAKDKGDIMQAKKLEKQLNNVKEQSDENEILILKQEDSDYLETNNFAYNQHKTTQANLMTLGKYGEKVPFLEFNDNKNAKNVARNIGKGLANVWLAGRNYIARPIDKAVGTYVVAPVHQILFNSEKNSRGIYKGMASHRYTARKDYFTYEYMKKLAEENQKREEEGQELKKPSALKLIFGIRWQAIKEYKKGNVAVLTAGAHEIEEDTIRREAEERMKKQMKLTLEKSEDKMLDTIYKCKQKINYAQTEDEKADWQATLQEATSNLIELQEKIKENEELHIEGSMQRDPVSLAQHDKANKANITRVVSGVKAGAKVAAMSFVGKNLSKIISERITEEKWIPETTRIEEQWVPGEINTDSLSNIKVRDLVEASQHDKVSYSSVGGNTVLTPSQSYIRGIAINDVNGTGQTISGSDGIGFSIAGRTDAQIDAMNNDIGIFDAMAETMTKAGQPVSAQELMNQIINNEDPQLALEKMLNNTRIWVSTKENGVPTGWLDVSDGVKAISQKIQEGHIETTEVVVPGHTTTVVRESMKEVIDGRAVAVEGILSAGFARDLYELARRTKSKEEMGKEGTYDKNKIQAYQRDNKPKERYYNGKNKWGFQGTKKEDYASGYDENKMGEHIVNIADDDMER